MTDVRRALQTASLLLGVCLQTSVLAQALEKSADQVSMDIFAGDARGPHQTGTFEEYWIDEQRDEPTTTDPNDKRRLMVQLWYPATFKPNAARAPYILHPDLYPTDKQKWLKLAKNARTTSVLNAPLLTADAPFPVVIYNPGGGHPPFTGTSQTEYLASHGYVVVAIGHTGLTGIARFPDGSTYKLDTNDPEPTAAERQTMTDADAFRLEVERSSATMMPLHVKDISYVLDRLQAMNAKPGHRFYRHLDFDRVGSMGWSLGGALSLQASRDEPRIKAAVNLDGWLYTDVYRTGTKRPVMQIHQSEDVMYLKPGQSAAKRETLLYANSLLWQFFSKTEADWYDVTLNRAHHGHFSDRILFTPMQEQYMHPRVAQDWTNRFVLEFFDKYLRGQAEAPFLSGTRTFPDALVLRGTKQAGTQ
ncbi:alpha/beta hydrolase family protein [Steroidobacter sp.]|uniref:alpha/beta hydrolase family protein n=1 Tax=Steroidobacter sp. TaxID=1978227 RepID=UPI001A6211C1|nr:hypothetical protein [Steroidobacter sp.]MBL8270973.1 hypothetical protein [Steroidobacter sp.]